MEQANGEAPNGTPRPTGGDAPPRKLYVETVGCQMNALDSELVVADLRRQGYSLTADPAEADTVLFNTCSVRQHAEDKIYSALGRLKRAKEANPDLVIGVLGCMAQKDKQLVFERAPHVDLICSPGQLARVPELVAEARSRRAAAPKAANPNRGARLQALGLDRNQGTRLAILDTFESYDPLRDVSMRPTPFQAFVRLQMGCDKFCTYCIVPTVRGPEQGRPPELIVAEARALAADGAKEITLLGQTVNSYRHPRPEGGFTRLADLLRMLHDLPGLQRIKFITNYPKDMTDDLLEAVATLPKVAPYLHVPVQSGCDRVLKAMKRGYTVGEYREMLARIRARLPEATVSSDFIVGFPGEDEASFLKSADLLAEARFKNSFVFKYSPREGTKAFPLPDDVPDEEKRRRNQHLLAIQNEIGAADNAAQVGRLEEILVEGPSKLAAAAGDDVDASPVTQMAGRTRADRIVLFTGNRRQAGQLLPARIVGSTPTSLLGEIVTHELVSLG